MRPAALAVALLVALAPTLPLAAAYPDPAKVPRYHDSDCIERFNKRFVHDYTGLMGAVWGREIEGAACEVYAATSAHYVLVTVPDTEGEILEDYAFHLFEEWGVGDEERHDGLMLLYVADHLGSGEPALRIEVGYGLEGVLSSPVTEMAWDLMVEARDEALAEGQTPDEARAYAIATGSLFLLIMLRDSYTDGAFPSPEPRSSAPPLLFWIVVILLVLLLIVALAHASRGSRGWGYHPTSPAWSGRTTRIWLPPTYGGGLGGGGFGGGGFGGGRSGGGGRGGKF